MSEPTGTGDVPVRTTYWCGYCGQQLLEGRSHVHRWVTSVPWDGRTVLTRADAADGGDS